MENIVSQIYTTEVCWCRPHKLDKTTRTARAMAEVQRDSYEALAENFAAAQRRSIGLAEGGLEFMKLQGTTPGRLRSGSLVA